MTQCGAWADGGSPSRLGSGTPVPAMRSSKRSTPGRSPHRTLITCWSPGADARISLIMSG